MRKKPGNHKKVKVRKVYWFLAGTAAIVVVFVLLLLYKPARYSRDIAVEQNGRQVSRYLTHQLLPDLYNGAQRAEPFELVINQEGINDIIASSKWPKQTEGISFSAPVVLFVPGRIVLMGTTAAGGAELVVTAEIEPALDRQGLLNLSLTKVLVGAVNVGPIAKVLLKQVYSNRVASKDVDTGDLEPLIMWSLLDDKPFEPVFEIENNKIRIEKITIEQGKLTIRLVPAS